MYHIKFRKNNREKRKLRIRSRVTGTAERPRLSVFRSNKYIYAQLIDDVNGKTLADVSSETKSLHQGMKKFEAAFEVGKLLAEKAKKQKITNAVFDRSGYRYHGRVENLAQGAREGGLTL